MVGCFIDSCEFVNWIEVAQDIVVLVGFLLTDKKHPVPEHLCSLVSILSRDSSRVRSNVPFINNNNNNNNKYKSRQ